jgi:hypothetical protein
MVTRTATAREPEAKYRAAEKAPQCRHHWMIETPQSRISHGECLLCQARREFPNYLSDCLIDSDKERFEQWLGREGRRRSKKGADSPYGN